MSLTNDAETAILNLLFENIDWAGIGDGTGLQGSGTIGSFYIALFTDDPTDTGSIANECSYTGYARKAIARGAFTVSGNTAENTGAITFDPCTGGSETATYFAVCKAGTAGVTDLVAVGAITTPGSGLAISAGITPEFAAAALVVTAD